MTNLPELVSKNIDRFTGRAWLLPKLLGWWDNNDERLFLLTGDPGTGKSMILAWLAGFGSEPEDPTTHAQLVRLREVVKAAHFCQASTRNTSPQAFAENIANQLTSSVTGFADALTATLAERVQITATQAVGTITNGGTATNVAIGRIDLAAMGDELSFDRAFTLPLKKMYARGHSEPMLLMVDALDEALGYKGDKTIPELLSTLGDLPPQVRILLTTRNDPRVLAYFDEIEPFDLIKNAPPDVDDVQNYVFHRLNDSAGLTKTQETEFSRRVATQAKGVFLYAAIVLDELLPRLPQIPDLETYPLPDGLSKLYHNSLMRKLGTEDNGRRWHNIFKPLLGLIAVAQGEGLTSAQLSVLIGQEVAEPLDACKQFLSGELPNGPFRPFHKSFTDFLLEDKKKRYSIDAQAMHGRIAEGYWTNYRKDWSKCDDYGLTYLVGHLYQGKQFDRLAALITQEWMHARVEHDEYRYDGFIADLTLAWQHATEDALANIKVGKEPSNWPECIRYALIRSSITSISSQYPTELVKQAIKIGFWSLARVLSMASKVRHPVHRARLFQAVLEADYPAVSKAERCRLARDTLPVVLAIEDPESRTIALSALAPNLTESDKGVALSEALSAAHHIEDGAQRAIAMATLAPQLGDVEKETTLREAISVISAALATTRIGSGSGRPGLGYRFGETEPLKALVALAPQLTGALLAEALSLTCCFQDLKVHAMAALAPQLGDVEKETTLREAILATRQVKDDQECASALVALAPSLTGPLVNEALSAARESIKDNFSFVEVLSALAQQFSEAEKNAIALEALLKAKGISDEELRASALTAIAGINQLNRPILLDVLRSAQEIINPMSRNHVIVALSSGLIGPELEACLNDALLEAIATEDDHLRVWLLTELSPCLRPPLLNLALSAARAIPDASSRAEMLAALLKKEGASPEKEAVLRDAIDAAQKCNWRLRAFILAALAPHLSGPLLSEAMSAVAFEDESYCASALIALARGLNGRQKKRILLLAMAAVTAITDEGDLGEQLAALAPQLSGPLLAEALTTARAISDEHPHAKAKVLTALMGCFKGEEQKAILQEAQSEARNIGPDASRGEVLATLVPQLTGTEKASTLRDALSAVRAIKSVWADGGYGGYLGDEDIQAKLLAQLAPELSGTLLTEALSVAKDMQFGRARAKTMAVLACRLPAPDKELCLSDELSEMQKTTFSHALGDEVAGLACQLLPSQLATALLLARRIDARDPHAKAKALTALAQRLSGPEKDVAIAEALSTAYRIEDKESFAVALAALAQLLTGPEKDLALTRALASARESNGELRATILAALAPHLNGRLLAEALSVAREMNDEQCLALAVNAIAQKAREGEELLEELRQYIVNRLESGFTRAERREVYQFCANEHLLRPPYVSTEFLEKIAIQISEIGIEWHWH
ncbi:MAG: hypothetical protein PHO08_05930 [Methylococcales bacterium]|nr:hypothetical protein [Methylococcales bacterium]